MKKIFGILVIAAFLLYPCFAFAGILGTATIGARWSAPTGHATFPSETNNFYLDYDAYINGSSTLSEIFCVEDADGTQSTENYTLLSLDSSLGGFGLNANAYMTAGYIASNFSGSGDSVDAAKAAAQIAIWEVIFDYGNYNLSAGSFTFNDDNSYKTAADTILAGLPTTPTSISSWVLAVSPEITSGNVVTAPYQNYLIPNPVPEPATMLLLGMGLAGLAGFGRKKFFMK